MKMGASNVTAMYLGSTAISRGYLGGVQVFGLPPELEYAVRLDMYDTNTLFSDVDGTTLAAVDTAVAQVSDKSGNSNHATQSVVADRPVRRTVGGLTYLDFNGINHFMNVAPDPTWRMSSVSVFIPVRTTATTGVMISRLGGTNAYFALINDNNTNVADINAGTITYHVNGTAHPGINRQQLHGLIATGEWVILECAGVNLAGSRWADGMRINGLNNTTFMADADIGAVRFVPTSEIAANRAAITAELADKFGVTL